MKMKAIILQSMLVSLILGIGVTIKKNGLLAEGL